MNRLLELAGVFLKLGTIGFGGPAALVGLMEEEVVRRRAWLDHQAFVDLMGVTNLIPGPNAVEMAGHIGFRRAGGKGLLVAAVAFILPATLISIGFGWIYVAYGTLPHVEPLLRGIKPAVLVVVLGALARLAPTAARSRLLVALGAGVAAAALAGADEVLTFLVGSLLGALLLRWAPKRPDQTNSASPAALLALPGMGKAPLLSGGAVALGAAGAAGAASVPLWKLALLFLKIGAVLYGGGYVLIAYLEGDLVRQYGWLTHQQLLDAIAVGQFTPGPILCTATFVGYVLAGLPGAMAATAAVFAPSFVFVAAVNPLIPRLRRSAWAGRFLDAVNAASLGLMVAVTWTLGRGTLRDGRDWLIALVAAGVALRWKVAPAWLVLGGALAGALLYFK